MAELALRSVRDMYKKMREGDASLAGVEGYLKQLLAAMSAAVEALPKSESQLKHRLEELLELAVEKYRQVKVTRKMQHSLDLALIEYVGLEALAERMALGKTFMMVEVGQMQSDIGQVHRHVLAMEVERVFHRIRSLMSEETFAELKERDPQTFAIDNLAYRAWGFWVDAACTYGEIEALARA